MTYVGTLPEPAGKKKPENRGAGGAPSIARDARWISAWPQGQGLLGLETSAPYPYPYPILTPLTVGGGRITYYFRRHFNLSFNPAGVTLTASNYVDDGAVYYLNGTEVGRVRIGTGPVNAATLAALATPEGVVAVLDIPPNTLTKGDNVFAVEVHQNAANSSDIVFGMSLTAVLPAAGPATITAQPGSRSVEEGDPTTFGVLVSGTPPFHFQWSRNGQPLPGVTNQSYFIPAATTNDAGTYSLFVGNALGNATSDDAILTVTPAPFTLLTLTNHWRFDQSGANLGTGWRGTSFNDGAWPSGSGLFYNETAALPAPKNTPLLLTNGGGQPILTYYFRAHFNWIGPTAGARLTARMLCDDGAVLYLNGAEARRIGMAAGAVGYTTLASRAVVDATTFDVYTLSVTNLVSGDNVLAVEVHQSAANSSDVVFGLALGTNFVIPLPDLVIYGPLTNPRLETHTFSLSDCEVSECAIPGTRRLLRFDTYTRNQGSADLILGDPVGNPLYQFDSCHGHYHFQSFADYRLLDLLGNLAAVGHKVGFCLEDLERFDPSVSATTKYTCAFQGIQRGWADIYNSALPCQYIDVTGVPDGDYILELTIDPENRIEELDESNNVTRVPVTLAPPCTVPPANDSFAAAQIIPYRTATALGNNDCATKQPSEPNHAGNAGAHSIWYRWTAPFSGPVIISTDGSGFDTILALYTGTAVNSLTLIASDDDAGEGVNSLITPAVTLNTVYYIAVDGFDGAVGDVALNINPAGNDAFANCLVLSGPSGSVSGRNTSASREAGEPNHAGIAGGRSLWYCWTAPSSGPVSMDTRGSRFDTVLAVYTGSSVGSLVPVASDNNSGPNLTSRLSFNATAGTVYRIAVDGVNGASGVSTLNWRPGVVITSVTRLPDAFRFILNGSVGDRYVIETSSDLTAWSLWMRATNTIGSVTVTGSSTNSHQFYRARTE